MEYTFEQAQDTGTRTCIASSSTDCDVDKRRVKNSRIHAVSRGVGLVPVWLCLTIASMVLTRRIVLSDLSKVSVVKFSNKVKIESL